jgi:hypothetical protein
MASFNFVAGERVSNVEEVTSWDWDVSPIEIRGPRGSLFCHILKVLMNDCLLLVVFRDPTVSILEPVDEIFPSTAIDVYVEISSVSVPLFEAPHTRGLVLS